MLPTSHATRLALAVLITLAAHPAAADDGGRPAACPVDPSAETVIAEDGACATVTGDASAIRDAVGHDGHCYLTAVDVAEPHYAEGIFWFFDVVVAGEYDVYAYVPSGIGVLTTGAIYKIQYDGAAEHVIVDQAGSQGGWALLGRIPFAAGGDQWVRLGDNYGDTSDVGRDVVLDALRLVPVEPAGGDDDTTSDDDGSDDDTFDEHFQPHDGGSLGCSCSATPTAAPPMTAPLLLLAAALVHRRRHGSLIARPPRAILPTERGWPCTGTPRSQP